MNIKNLVLGIGIVVVFALVLWQGIEAFYPSPSYEKYCNVREPFPIDKFGNFTNNRSYCEMTNGTWFDKGAEYCDYYFECQKRFDSDRDAYSRNVFFISLIVAIVVLLLGYLVLTIEPVGSALMGSGIWAIFYGSVVNWRNFSSIWRFLLLLVALVLLVFIAVRLNRKKK